MTRPVRRGPAYGGQAAIDRMKRAMEGSLTVGVRGRIVESHPGDDGVRIVDRLEVTGVDWDDGPDGPRSAEQ